jgi:PAS domain S-box-containing protein
VSEMLRALIIEDSEDDALLLVRLLRQAGYDVIFRRVQSEPEMMVALKSESWDIVLSDHNMPGFSSRRALELVRQRGGDIPFIIISGMIGEDAAVEAMRAGAQDYIMKGHLARLVPAIQRELHEAQMRRDRNRAGEVMQEALRVSEEHARLALRAGQMAAWEYVLPDGDSIWNEEHYRMLGYAPGSIKPAYEAWIARIHPSDRVGVEAHFQRSLREGGEYTDEFRVLCPDGTVHWVEARGLTERVAGGRYMHSCGVMLDVTVRKQTEDELRRTIEQLGHANMDLEQFAYITSHDLQEPLRMVSAFIGLLRDDYQGKLDVKADEYIAFALEGALRMQALIKDLLEYSRIGARMKDVVLTDVKESLLAALANLKMAIEESQARITLHPLPMVMADGLQLTMVFQNLVGNAIKYRQPHVTPEIDIKAEKEEGEWRFTIRDNGIGIDPQCYGKLFKVFQRLHTRDHYQGTGIGLAICKKIVEGHGGRIWAESAIGQGSSFYFTLPDSTAGWQGKEPGNPASGK